MNWGKLIMRVVKCEEITNTVSRLFIEACYYLPDDVINALKRARKEETSPISINVLDKLLINIEIASKGKIPLCQDSGVAVVFMEIGQEVLIVGGNLYDAVNEGVKMGYEKGYLNNLMVVRPTLDRAKAKFNTPAMIHIDIVPGKKIKIIAMPKGGGCENMSRLVVLPPSAGRDGIINYILSLVEDAGPNPCPPIILGVGIGGTTETSMLLAKKALLRKVGEPSPNQEVRDEVRDLELEILEKINNTGIGAMGYGGKITALGVHIETCPTLAGSLPLAVNFQCHCSRHAEAII